MKKGLLTTIITLVLVGTVSLSAFAYGNGRGQGGNRRGALGFFQDLDLSPEQQQKLLEIRQDFQKDTQPLRFEMQKKQLEFRQLWSAQTLNRNAIEAKEKEITGLRIQMVTKAR
ncbi:MAG: Spy/CpxP family protein refolding chaperone, partial [Bacteroidota bacterium]